MSEPEISRRCRSCGASIPRRASFCPECGFRHAASPEGSGNKGRKAHSRDAAASVQERMGPVFSEATEAGTDHDPKSSRTAREGASTLYGTGYETGKRGRVRDAKDAMKENLLPRVEKIKSVSQDVLDEASVDPSFRFLLVAGVLFVIFILLLILSHMLH